jgi:hypothetical protein
VPLVHCHPSSGFYDLYKNVPHFKSLVIRAFMPASYLFEWLELHTQVCSLGMLRAGHWLVREAQWSETKE